MASVFKKGQRVTLIKSWDNCGTVALTSAIVHSCGAKRMVLTNTNTGEELGREFRPQREGYSNELVVDSSEDAEVVGIEMAVRIRAEYIAHAQKSLSEAQNPKLAFWIGVQSRLEEVLADEAKIFWR